MRDWLRELRFDGEAKSYDDTQKVIRDRFATMELRLDQSCTGATIVSLPGYTHSVSQTEIMPNASDYEQ